MERDAEDLLEEALKLPTGERARLVSRLIESLDDDEEAEDPVEVEKAWAKEIERRIREIDAGTAKTVPLEVALARAQRALERAKRPRRSGGADVRVELHAEARR